MNISQFCSVLTLLLFISISCAVEHKHGEMDRGPIFKREATLDIDRLPACTFKTQLAQLSPKARAHALRRMQEYGIGHHDLSCLHADQQGEMHFQCANVPEESALEAAAAPLDSAAASIWDSGFTPSGPVAITAPPVFNSKLGSVNIVYIDFNGDVITGTAWNSHSIGAPTINARSFSTDADATTFSNTEQTVIYQVWQRVAEDLAAYDINVTTDPYYDAKGNRGPNIGQILVCHNGDFKNDNAGGRAYVGVFGNSNYASYYSPALVYYNKLSSRADYIAEAASHEFGHNLGLNHDGTSALDYYNGHGSGQTSWGPIMGTGYNRNVSQWSNGEYYDANNSQNDEIRLINELGYRADDHANSIGAASPLQVSAGITIDNSMTNNQGIIAGPNDPDVFKFPTAAGSITLRVDPFLVGTNTRGGNLDVKIRLLDGSGNELAVADPSTTTYAEITTVVSAGTYYLEISGVGVGNPATASPSGYVDRFSQGQYFISGTLQAVVSDQTAPTATLVVNDIYSGGLTSHDIVVTYTDNVAIDVSTLSNTNLRVTGPNSFNQFASFISVNINSDGKPRVATYRISAPGGTWDFADNGTYQVAIEAAEIFDTNAHAVASDVYETFEVSTNLPPVITSSLNASGTQSVAFSYKITATNTPTSFNSGSLPSGLTFNSSTGLIAGTPTVIGTFNVPITATNGFGSDVESLRITINPRPPVITSPLSANGTVGVPFSYTFTGTNSPTSFFMSYLPAGLTLNTSTGLISGTPSSANTTSHYFSMSNGGGSASNYLVITIAPPDLVAPTATAISLVVKGRVSTDTTSLTLNGISTSIDGSGHYVQAVPVTAGASTIIIIATDASGNSSTRTIDVASTSSIPPIVN